jgi:hypothetical protein
MSGIVASIPPTQFLLVGYAIREPQKAQNVKESLKSHYIKNSVLSLGYYANSPTRISQILLVANKNHPVPQKGLKPLAGQRI